MKKKIKKIILILVGIIVVVILGLQFFYKQGGVVGAFMDFGMLITSGMKHNDPSKAKADYTISSTDLYNAFKSDTAAANNKYISKIVLVEGGISAIDPASGTVSLNSVACKIDSTEASKIGSYKVGDNVKLQGIVVDYNDLLDEIDVSQCTFK